MYVVCKSLQVKIMLIVLSPAKSLDYETPVPIKNSSELLFLDDAEALIQVARKLDIFQIAKLMDISSELAELNFERFKQWSPVPESGKARPAIFAFNGDVYDGLGAASLNLPQFDYLQTHLRILSGLYGMLRPLDQMQAYRLEMGSRLENPRGKNLYEFWGSRVTERLNETIQKQNSKVLINLASEEYFKVLKPRLLKVPVITPIFQDFKNGQYKIISFYAKRARGLMLRFCALNKIVQPEQMKDFDLDGYAYCQQESGSDRWVFRRRLA